MAHFEGRALACFRGGRLVFQNLDVSLGPGDAILVIGPNGSGKSTLLRLLAGLLKAADGALTFAGLPVADDMEAHHRRIAYLGHLNAVKSVLTVRENIAVWVGEAGPPARAPEEALATFDLLSLAEQPGRLLSAGQRRRLALARLLACGGDIWLLDEPSVGLDRGSQERLEAAIADHRTAGGRVVLASHTAIDLPEASRLDLADYQPDSLPELIW